MIDSRPSHLILVGAIILIIGVVALVADPPPTEGHGNLWVWPQEKIVSIADTFSLLIAVDSLDSIRFFNFYIEIDTTVIQVDSIREEKSFFSGVNFFWKDTIYLLPPDTDSTYVYDMHDGYAGTQYVNGPGTLARMYFTAVGHGFSPVLFRRAWLEFYPFQPLPVADSMDALVIVCPTDETFGDANNDGLVNISDVVYLINFIFSGGPPPEPIVLMGDADCSGFTNITDAVYLIQYIFAGGDPPCNPCPE